MIANHTVELFSGCMSALPTVTVSCQQERLPVGWFGGSFVCQRDSRD
jgi:hypothetical protein